MAAVAGASKLFVHQHGALVEGETMGSVSSLEASYRQHGINPNASWWTRFTEYCGSGVVEKINRYNNYVSQQQEVITKLTKDRPENLTVSMNNTRRLYHISTNYGSYELYIHHEREGLTNATDNLIWGVRHIVKLFQAIVFWWKGYDQCLTNFRTKSQETLSKLIEYNEIVHLGHDHINDQDVQVFGKIELNPQAINLDFTKMYQHLETVDLFTGKVTFSLTNQRLASVTLQIPEDADILEITDSGNHQFNNPKDYGPYENTLKKIVREIMTRNTFSTVTDNNKKLFAETSTRRTEIPSSGFTFKDQSLGPVMPDFWGSRIPREEREKADDALWNKLNA